MSHQPERKEKDCLNCGAIVQGRYCHICGQENIVTKQSFWSLSKHFVFDIFHFDGKFFETLKHLFFKPGAISREYALGKRTKYLDPIRMYLFTSALFFLVFFSVESTENVVDIGGNQDLSKAQRLDLVMEMNEQAKERPADSSLHGYMDVLLDSTFRIGLREVKDSMAKDSIVSFHGKLYRLRVVKDSQVDPFEEEEAEGWMARTLQKKWTKFKTKYSDDLNRGYIEFLKQMLHKLPYLLFVSLPFFAGILKLLYIRRKNFYYSDHAVFTLHHYIVSFILILLMFVSSQLKDTTGWGIFGNLTTLLLFLWPLYLLLGMKRFYLQGWGKTLGKFLLLNILGLITVIFLLLVFIFFSIFQL